MADDAPNDIVVGPKLLWWVLGVGGPFDSLGEAFVVAADSESKVPCLEAVYGLSPQPQAPQTINGIRIQWGWSLNMLTATGSGQSMHCIAPEISQEVGTIVLNWTCPRPQGSGYNQWSQETTKSPSDDLTVRCRLKLSPPPPNTDTCTGSPVGDPTYPETGVQEEVETDYASPNGLLDFVRTYRSDIGGFRSVLDAQLVDYSPGGTPQGCVAAGYVRDPNAASTYQTTCFALMADSISRYSLMDARGRQATFVGSPDATTANANVNDRLTQATDSSGTLVWRAVRSDNAVETYSTAGLLLERVRSSGQRVTYQYSDASTPPSVAPQPGQLISLTDPFGRQLKFYRNATGRLDHMAGPAGDLYQYGYDAQGNLASVTYPDGSSKQYHYNESAYTGGQYLPNALTGITDENAVRYGTYTYDSIGRVLSTEQPGGTNHHSFSYGSGAATRVTDPLATQRYYRNTTLFGSTYRTGISQPAGSGCGESYNAIGYDANGNVKTRQDFDSHQTTFTYDLTRNLETQRVEAAYTAQARTITTTWHPDWRLKARRAEPKKITAWVYNGQPDPTSGGGAASCAPGSALLPDGKPIAVLCKRVEQATTDATGASGFSATVIGSPRTWTWTYNAYGQVLTANGPRTDVTDVTTYTYYGDTASDHTLGDLYTVKDALGHITTYTTYDKNGRPLTIVDPNSLTTTLTYFPRGWLKSRQVGSELTTYDYDAVGQLKKVTAPDLSWIGYDYDPAHRLTDIYDNLGNRITYTLDNAGNRTREDVTDPGGTLARTQTRVYDALSRLQNIVQPE
jgi:YD repeat-containing protein